MKKKNSYLTVPDPDLEIRGVGGSGLADPQIRGRRSPKKIFPRAPPLDPPLPKG